MSHPGAAVAPAKPEARLNVRCREIVAADLPEVVALLQEGFPIRSADYWRRGFDKLATTSVPAEFPRYGFVLDTGSLLVGILLMLYIQPSPGRFEAHRGNFSSWYVKPEFRLHTITLIRHVLRLENITFVNISASPPTFKFIEAQGFQRYAEGVFVALSWLSARGSARVRRVRPDSPATMLEGMSDASLLRDAASGDAIVLVAQSDERRVPFVFIRRSVKRSPRLVAQLAYCRQPSDFRDLAGPLGRYLLLREGLPVTACDASASIPGCVGFYLPNYRPKYFRGPSPPPLDDIAYTEALVFGI